MAISIHGTRRVDLSAFAVVGGAMAEGVVDMALICAYALAKLKKCAPAHNKARQRPSNQVRLFLYRVMAKSSERSAFARARPNFFSNSSCAARQAITAWPN